MRSVLRALAVACCVPVLAAATPTALRAGFAAPPTAARPLMWWFWGESVTTDSGITRDLEALKHAGFGGVVVYEQVFGHDPAALRSLSPAWLARVRFAAAECARLGLSLEVNAGSGYVAGGPWITPALGMQRLVASELRVTGGRHIVATLPQPPTKLGYYRDVAVLAYPSPAGDAAPPAPRRSSAPANVDLDALFRRGGPRARIAAPGGIGPVLVQLDYGRPFTARSLSYSVRPNTKALVIATQVPTSWARDFYGEGMRLSPPIGELQASDDGAHWRHVCTLPALGYQQDNWTRQTVAFPAATARYFRLDFHDWGHNQRANDDDLVIGGVVLRGDARIDHWESKSGNVVAFSDPDRTPAYAGAEVIDPAAIIDLTSHVTPAGQLTWDAPPGHWTLLRLGHTPTGAKTKHGRPETMGLECDKLSAAAAQVQFDHYAGVILRAVQGVPGARLAGVSMDSAEHGSQNWTADFPAQFRRRRGYDLTRFLPAMVGRVVGSPAASDRFLFDVRRTIADLMSDEYYGTFQRLCHAHGMTLSAEAPGIATCLPSDNLQAKGRTDVPMGEFWMTQRDGTMDCKEAASAAHVYGLPVAAAESFTGSRADVYPAMMKPLADAALALGINRFAVLADVHQPWGDDRKPGVTEPRFFLPYQRNNTWWDDSAGFWAALSRSSYLLRQGRPVADLLYDLGDDTPLKIATWRMRPVPPAGYDYDVCGDEVLLTRAAVRDGRIVLPDGMSYRVLVLAGGDRMTLAAARKVEALVRAGAVVLGPVKPVGSPSLADGTAGDAEVRRIADELWGTGPLSAAGERRFGAGRVVWGRAPAQVLAELNVPPDFVSGRTRLAVLYAHRASPHRDFYFVANHRPTPVTLRAVFRVSGREPQLWDPDGGGVAVPAEWHATPDGRTEVTLPLGPYASVFVVFAPRGGAEPVEVAPAERVDQCPTLETLAGPWAVSFSPRWGGPAHTTFASLTPWNQSADPGIRYYSGAAVYRKTFTLGAVPAGHRVLLDLGGVVVLAAVRLNGRELGTLWHAPFAVDVTTALRPGRNDLEVRVVNTWVNRLVRDAGLPPAQRLTWTTNNPYRRTDALQLSGLLGPVRLRDGGPEPRPAPAAAAWADCPEARACASCAVSVAGRPRSPILGRPASSARTAAPPSSAPTGSSAETPGSI